MSESSPPVLVSRWVQGTAYGIALLLAIIGEAIRWSDPQTRISALRGWLCGQQADWLPFLPLLVIAPLIAWGMRRSRRRKATTAASSGWLAQSTGQGRLTAWLAALGLGIGSFLVTQLAGWNVDSLPPAYHDEYSYQFQAETFLHGRIAFPSFSPHPELFNQMHVLNEGTFASRYFPGTGAWIAPFLAFGQPLLGHQLAQALATVLLFWIGREVADNATGFIAGALFALSPGMILFSHLLLAHHPTLIGVLLFTLCYLRWCRTRSAGLLVLAGLGLAGAMLSRPMTAAGFALPFGVQFASWIASGRLFWGTKSTEDSIANVPFARRLLSACLLAGPLVLGIAVQLGFDRVITGELFTTPYQLYTDLYTPRHRYGFNNVVIGEQHLGPKVLDNYDRWAENLTPQLAMRNVATRLVTSLRWTLGVIPLTAAGIVWLLSLGRGDPRRRFFGLSILSLHLAHVPYWFSGIMGWHYVLETAPLWLLLFADASRRLFITWKQSDWTGLRYWWVAVIGMAVAVNLATVPPLWPGRLEQGLAEIAFPKRRYAEFRKTIEQLRNGRDVIVFVVPDPSDRHIDLISNPPDLSGPVLVARLDDPGKVSERARLFPDRMVLVFDAATREFRHGPEHHDLK